MDNLITLRNRDLYAAYEKVLKKLGAKATTTSRAEIYTMTINQPAKQFYVTPDYAMRMVTYTLKNGKQPTINSPYRLEMHNEITRRYIQIRNQNPQITVAQAIDTVINSPAPKFYISPQSAKVIFHYILRKKRCHAL